MLSGTSNKRTTWKSRAGGGDGTVSGTVGDGFCSTLKLNCFCRRLRKLRFNGFLQNSKAIITLCKCNSLTVSVSVSSAVSRAKRQFKGCLEAVWWLCSSTSVCSLAHERANWQKSGRFFRNVGRVLTIDNYSFFFARDLFSQKSKTVLCLELSLLREGSQHRQLHVLQRFFRLRCERWRPLDHVAITVELRRGDQWSVKWFVQLRARRSATCTWRSGLV